MRSRPIFSTLLVLVAGAGWYLGWALYGRNGLAIAIALLSPLIGVAAAPLIVLLLSQSVRAAKLIAYGDVQGRYFEYKGHSLAIFEDLAGARWIRTKDIRRVVVGLPRDQVLVRIAPDDTSRIEGKNELLFLAQGLSRYLERGQDESTIRFRNWLEREVIFPAQRAHQAGPAGAASREESARAAP